MTTEKIKGLIEASGAEFTEDGRGVFFADEDLGSLVPVCRITSLEKAPAEIGRFARFFDFDAYEPLQTAWDLTADQWGDREWEQYEITGRYLDASWKDLALCLLLADADDAALQAAS
ncbi:MAG: hypothetical protein HDQ87_05430 [Clostridia bacterium]|nr:hypothetical protein [Clostridia bacterium]